MSLILPKNNRFEFTAVTHNETGSNTIGGVSVTPAQNTMGSWTEICSDTVVTEDIYFIEIYFSDNSTAAQIRDTIVNIGIDPAGGTSFSTIISNLLASSSAAFFSNSQSYRFPIFIPKGSSIGAQGSVNNASVGTFNVSLVLYGKPSRPELIWAGTRVDAIGINTGASTASTTITPGNGVKGSWISIGTTARDYNYFDIGFSGDGTTTLASMQAMYDLAYGDGSTKNIIILNAFGITGTSETIAKVRHCGMPYYVPAGSTLYMRAAATSTSDPITAAAYGVY